MSTVFPREEIKPPKNAYPSWLAAQLRGENVAVPEHVLEEYRVKIEPYMRQLGPPPKILGAEPNPPAKYVPPPTVVKQRAKVLVKFKVLNVSDRPIFGFGIRANDSDLITNEKGEVQIEVYPGHVFSWSTGRESGWSVPNGAKRKMRMTGMVPIAHSFLVSAPTTVYVYPDSGEFKIDGKTFIQPIIYTTS